MEPCKNIATKNVNTKWSRYPKTCATCTQELKNLEGCEHCKIPGCGNKKMDSKSICVGCQNYKKGLIGLFHAGHMVLCVPLVLPKDYRNVNTAKNQTA